jgi:hypothetical protein
MSPDWLTQLQPAHAPRPVGWWPLAPGWWVLTLLCLLIVITIVFWLRSPRAHMRRAALRELRSIRASDADGAAVARATQNLLRRYALAKFGQERVAKLSGEAWLRFVVGAGGDALSGGAGHSLLSAAFGNHTTDDREQWLAGAERFIRRARVARHREGRT